MARTKYYDPKSGTWKYAGRSAHVAPVQSVNNKTGSVMLDATDIGAERAGATASHNASETAHPYIIGLISALQGKAMLKSDISIKKAQLTLEDGTTVLIDVVVASDGTTIPQYTNLVPLAIDTDGSVYGDNGWMPGLRLSSSGSVKEHSSGHPYVTGFMPAKAGDVISIAGVQWYVEGSSINYICAYDSDFNFIGGVTPSGTTYGQFQSNVPVVNGSAELTVCTLPAALTDIAYIRINWVGTPGIAYDPANAIVTCNQEIA